MNAINFETTNYSGEVSQAQTADIQTTNYTGLSSHIQPIPTGYIIDQTEPSITFQSPNPTNASTINTDRVDINASYTEQYPDTCILEFNSVNYSMRINTINKDCTRTIGNVPDGTYTYYVWMNDTINNHNTSETRTLTINYTATWFADTSGGGSADGVPTKVTPPIPDIKENLTIIYPPLIQESIALDTEFNDTFSITNLGNTTTRYTLRFDCSNYTENRRLCPYVTFINTVYELNGSEMIDVSINEISKSYVEYSVSMPKNMPLTTYHADIVITSDKNETLILPIEYKTRTMLNMGEFLKKYYLLIILVVLVGVVGYILTKRRKKKKQIINNE